MAPNAAVAAKRSAEATAATISQACIEKRRAQLPWNQNQTTSTSTPVAHSKPTAVRL